MVDPKALPFYQRNDITGLFRYLGPLGMSVILDTLDDLLAKGFYPSPDRYGNELRASGVKVQRMEVAMAAVMAKNARQTPYDQFLEVYQFKISGFITFPERKELENYWQAGPKPGLPPALPKGPPPLVGARGDWYVTGLNANSLSVIVGAGFTAMTGNMVFTNVNGDAITKQLGWFGPSIGLSKGPAGKYLEKFPLLAKLMARFPTLTKILTDGGKEERLGKDVVQMLIDKSPTAAKAIQAFPKVASLIEGLVGMRGSASGGGENWKSGAIGFLAADSVNLKSEDFAGSCICYAVTGGAGAGLALNVGTYVLFFGIDPSWSPWSDPLCFVDLTRLDAKSKGVAVIGSWSTGGQLPQLGAGATIFYGELV